MLQQRDTIIFHTSSTQVKTIAEMIKLNVLDIIYIYKKTTIINLYVSHSNKKQNKIHLNDWKTVIKADFDYLASDS